MSNRNNRIRPARLNVNEPVPDPSQNNSLNNVDPTIATETHQAQGKHWFDSLMNPASDANIPVNTQEDGDFSDMALFLR